MFETGRESNVVDVDSSLTALVNSSHVPLRLYQDIKVVTRADAFQLAGVRLISGGGAGHEPGQCGYVGKGEMASYDADVLVYLFLLFQVCSQQPSVEKYSPLRVCPILLRGYEYQHHQGQAFF